MVDEFNHLIYLGLNTFYKCINSITLKNINPLQLFLADICTRILKRCEIKVPQAPWCPQTVVAPEWRTQRHRTGTKTSCLQCRKEPISEAVKVQPKNGQVGMLGSRKWWKAKWFWGESASWKWWKLWVCERLEKWVWRWQGWGFGEGLVGVEKGREWPWENRNGIHGWWKLDGGR